MQTKTLTLFSTAMMALALAASPAHAQTSSANTTSTAQDADFQQERATILAMAGDYRVRFDMQEATPWLPGYEPLERKISGGYESVRVIEDAGDRIVLQHLLVVGEPGREMVIKHWRQDWEYQPEKILAYTGPDTWEWEAVPAGERAGAWSQTVYQVDDSPRYAGVGRWETVNGVTRWVSGETWRPLARRDATRDPIYDRYASVNRHELTPTGWIHWQDNTKLMPVDNGEGLQPVVQEYVLNTYDQYGEYNAAAADSYWAATEGYWDAVRAKWDEVAAAKGGIGIEEEAETGTVISGRLLQIANEVMDGEMPEDVAIAEAVSMIEGATRNL